MMYVCMHACMKVCIHISGVVMFYNRNVIIVKIYRTIIVQIINYLIRACEVSYLTLRKVHRLRCLRVEC
jgi:hypothetical protein